MHMWKNNNNNNEFKPQSHKKVLNETVKIINSIKYWSLKYKKKHSTDALFL
jgi:hypothetical protein